MKIDILTLFPEICRAPLSESMLKRAQENKIVDLRIHNLRDWTTDKHHIVDDAPFGGGQGMVIKPEPIFAAVEELKQQTLNVQRSTSNAQKSEIRNQKSKIILMSPAGRRFGQAMATDLSRESHLIVICGHYEGVDQRVIEHLVDLEVSIGDYVLTNGAIAAVVLVDAVGRLLPGVLGYSLNNDAFHMTTPLPSGDSCIRAMRDALADAQVGPEQIDYVNDHASSTQLNDSAETMSIKDVLGEHAKKIPVSGTKGYHGHPLGATGAIEAALCALALDRQWVPPTINYQNPDPACDLDVVPNHGRAAALNYVMSNSFGFGGINACIVLGRVRD